MFSPKNWWNIWPTGLFRKATPPECPGHSGGVAFLKSPVGQMFHQFFGENMLRADVCNAVDELGQLLDHTGPV
ncbi:MAG: hypothetical protein ACKO6D_05100, partial [Rubrivivax sp.]